MTTPKLMTVLGLGYLYKEPSKHAVDVSDNYVPPAPPVAPVLTMQEPLDSDESWEASKALCDLADPHAQAINAAVVSVTPTVTTMDSLIEQARKQSHE